MFTDDSETHVLAPILAGNIFVTAAAEVTFPATIDRLTALPTGRTAVIHKLDDALQGFTRRRLLDLGLTPGTDIKAQYAGFLGDPVAFKVRGSLIALRRDQARHVLIRTNGGQESDRV